MHFLAGDALIAREVAYEPCPTVHIQKIQELVGKGVTHIFIHSVQEDQVGVVNVFGEHVLPRLKEGAVTGTRMVTA